MDGKNVFEFIEKSMTSIVLLLLFSLVGAAFKFYLVYKQWLNSTRNL